MTAYTATATLPASEKQIAFLRRLIDGKQHTHDADAVASVLSRVETMDRRQVSALIDSLIDLPWKPRTSAPQIQEGFYIKDEVVYKVQSNKAGTGVYAKRLDISGSKGHWHYEAGLTRDLVGLEPLTLEVAAQMGVASGVCVICGRTLDNPESIARGIGPVCATKF